jgi:hypothetical protein
LTSRVVQLKTPLSGEYSVFRRVSITATVIIALGVVGPASADLVVYSDPAQFAAASTNMTGIDFENLAPSGRFSYYGDPGTLAIGGVTFTTNSPLFVQNNNAYGTGAFLSAQQSDPEIVNIVLPSGITAVGSDYFSAYSTTVTLSSGQSFVIPGGTYPDLGFFGFTTDTAVSSIQLTVAGNGIDLDNFTFGQAVPEPTTIALLTTGMLVVAGGPLLRRRRREERRQAKRTKASRFANHCQ